MSEEPTMDERLVTAHKRFDAARAKRLAAQRALDEAKSAEASAMEFLEEIVAEACADTKFRESVSKYRAWVKAKRK
jgi:hypothetical protein